jgi:ribosomal protein L37AE/L43A
MTAIKDLVDLVTQLDASRFDSKTREAVLPIKEAALEVQREAFRLERQHAEEMNALKAENAELRIKVNQRPVAVFNKQTGTWLETSSGLHYCPRCWQDEKWSPMRDNKHGWTCPSCNRTFAEFADKAAEYASRPTPSAVIAAGAMNQRPPFTQG